MRSLVLFCILLTGCGGSREPRSADGAPATQARPGAGYAPAPGVAPPSQPAEPSGAPDSAVSPSPKDDDLEIRSEHPPRTVEEALAVVEREAALIEGAFAAQELAASCDRACRALGSLRRAVDGLCALTGDEDSRCESARVRLETNRGRLDEASCGC